MNADTGKVELSKLTKEEKIQIVKKKLEEVKHELGPNYPFVSKTRICEIVQSRLPMQPMYDLSTINMIMNETYK